MSDKDNKDPDTGLLHRNAFLAELRASQNESVAHLKRGCLLILHFPALKGISDKSGKDAAANALQSLLAVVETRLRSRDTIGRISEHSLCILLKQCLEEHALIIAEQYAALLRNVVIDTGQQRVPMDLHYRIVPLDARGSRPRKGTSKIIKAEAVSETSEILTSLSKVSSIDKGASKVVSLNTGKNGPLLPVKKMDSATTVTRLPSRHNQSLGHESVQNAWRLKPGLMLNHKPLVCCYRLQPVGMAASGESLQNSKLLSTVLAALSLNSSTGRPLVESQLIVPVDTAQLKVDTVLWLRNECRERRVAPSDVCLLMHIESVSRDLRVSLPLLRRLNRQGFKVMLEGVNSAAQYTTLQSLAGFDYILISARMLQESANNARVRKELDTLVEHAGKQHREICASGVDSKALLAHARSVRIDIGFGRQCGKSLPFPTESGSLNPES